MFYVYYVNFDYVDQEAFETEEAAHAHAKAKGWEYRIVLNPKGLYK